jgi:hypothetical protein
MLSLVRVLLLISLWSAIVRAAAELRCDNLKGANNHALTNIAKINMADFLQYGLGRLRVVATQYRYIGHSLEDKHVQHNICWSTPADPLPVNICRIVMSITSPMLTEPLRAELWLPDHNNGRISFIESPAFDGCKFVHFIGHLAGFLTRTRC